MGWRTIYGGLTAAGLVIIFASTNHFVEAMIGAPLFAIGAICLAVELLLG